MERHKTNNSQSESAFALRLINCCLLRATKREGNIETKEQERVWKEWIMNEREITRKKRDKKNNWWMDERKHRNEIIKKRKMKAKIKRHYKNWNK